MAAMADKLFRLNYGAHLLGEDVHGQITHTEISQVIPVVEFVAKDKIISEPVCPSMCCNDDYYLAQEAPLALSVMSPGGT